MTISEHILRVGETWHRWTTAADACRTGLTADNMRELQDAARAHEAALLEHTLGVMKTAHEPVLERSKARARLVRR